MRKIDLSQTLQLFVWLVVLALVPLKSLGHHGSNANPELYLAENLLELEGEITEIFWRNPHPRLRMAVLGERGEQSVWELELPKSIIGLNGTWGITADSFHVGDSIRAAGVVSRRNSSSIGLLHLLLPNGQEFVNGNRENRWSNQRVAELEFVPADASADERPDGIFRVWGSSVSQRSLISRVMPIYEDLYTERGRELAAEYDRVTDDPELNCEAGVPDAMLNPAPWEIMDRGDRVLIRLQYDLERVIYLDANALANEPLASSLGYSVGRWDGDTLIVTTTHVDWPYMNVGAPQSGQATHVERFTLSGSGSQLDYSLVSDDPILYTGPLEFKRTWAWEPGTEMTPYYCDAEWGGAVE